MRGVSTAFFAALLGTLAIGLSACGGEKADPAAEASPLSGQWVMDNDASIRSSIDQRRRGSSGEDPRSMLEWQGYLSLSVKAAFSAQFQMLEGEDIRELSYSGTWIDNAGNAVLTTDEGETFTLESDDEGRLVWEDVRGFTLILIRP